jgi:hypothetical protein
MQLLAIEAVPGYSRCIEMTLVALLMRLGVTTLRGSNPRSSATELFKALRPPLGDIALC